jgi:hypothetical protein
LQYYGATKRSIVATPDGKYYKIFDIQSTHARAYSVFGGDEKFWLSNSSTTARLGTPSVGIARVYFKDPTYFMVYGPKDFIHDNSGIIGYPWDYSVTEFSISLNNATYKFYPDFGKEYTYYPADGGAQANNLAIGYYSADTDRDIVEMTTTGSGQISNRDAVVPFPYWEAELEDIVSLDTIALTGDRDLSGALSIDGKDLGLTVASVPFTILFDANDTSLSDVVEAINEQVGETIAYSDTVGSASILVLESDKVIEIVSDASGTDATGTLLSPGWLGETISNVPVDSGEYKISTLDPTAIIAVELADFSATPTTVNFRTALVDAITEIATDYNKHIDNDPSAYHSTPDGTNDVTNTITYTSTEAQITTMWNEIIADYDAHDLSAVFHAAGNQHQTSGLGSTTTIKEVADEYMEFRVTYHDHISDATEHAGVGGADSDNVLKEVISSNVHYKITRQGAQASSPYTMSNSQDDTGLYYVDIELASEGIGNVFNVAEDTRFVVGGIYDCLGYYFSTENEATSYSTEEKMWIHYSPYFLDQDDKFIPANMILVDGQSFQVNYLNSSIVDEVTEYVQSNQVRNVLQNPLIRHLLPAYIYLYLEYTGGSQTSVFEDDLEEFVLGLRPDDNLSVYDLSQLLKRRSAEEMTNPVELVSLAWESDRSLRVYRSDNELNMGVRYALYTGLFTLNRL